MRGNIILELQSPCLNNNVSKILAPTEFCMCFYLILKLKRKRRLLIFIKLKATVYDVFFLKKEFLKIGGTRCRG